MLFYLEGNDWDNRFQLQLHDSSTRKGFIPSRIGIGHGPVHPSARTGLPLGEGSDPMTRAEDSYLMSSLSDFIPITVQHKMKLTVCHPRVPRDYPVDTVGTQGVESGSPSSNEKR